MAQGPVLIFDKSTIQTLTVDESVLLDNFYMSNITPVFFAECLADLERDMGKMKGTQESLVGALATRTPDSQACGNVFHMRILEGELAGQLDLSQVRFRAMRDRGQPVMTGDSKGILFHASDEEEAVRRWAERDFLGVERQLAKQWRRVIDRIDLSAMSANVLRFIGPWRKPTSLEDAKCLTDTIIDCMDQEWLLRFGLLIIGLPETTDFVVKRWITDRRKPLRSYLPYFVHILSINIFFALVLSTELLRNVKPSHQVDLAYLYYLPFCKIFTSRDNFHVQVAPLFMDPFQTFVHGDDLKQDLGRLHEMYQRLPQEELDKGLIGFADRPPEDTSFLTTRLWDKYLPKWREPHTPYTDLPKDILDAIDQMGKKVMDAAPTEAHGEYDVDKLDFVTISKKVSPKKGSYLRFSKETILKIHDDEQRKAREDEIKEGASVHEPGTAFTTLSEKLAQLSKDPKCSNVVVFLLMNKLDKDGKKVVRDGMGVAEIHPIEIHLFDDETQAFIKQAYDKSPVLSILVLWTRYGAGKLGILRLKPVPEDGPSVADEYEEWEGKAISAYLHRHNL
jgi:hypothetical protein